MTGSLYNNSIIRLLVFIICLVLRLDRSQNSQHKQKHKKKDTQIYIQCTTCDFLYIHFPVILDHKRPESHIQIPYIGVSKILIYKPNHKNLI